MLFDVARQIAIYAHHFKLQRGARVNMIITSNLLSFNMK